MFRYSSAERTIIAAAIALATCTVATADDHSLTLRMGRLSLQNRKAIQIVKVQNLTSRSFQWIDVECGFFNGKELVNSDTSGVENLPPGKTDIANVISFNAPGTTSAKCRIDGAY